MKFSSCKLLWLSLIPGTSLLFSCQSSEQPQTREEPVHEAYCLPDKFKNNLEFVEPQRVPIKEFLPLTGIIEVNPDKQVHFGNLLQGVVKEVYFTVGDYVSKGQILAELLSPQYADLEAQLKTLEAQLKTAERQYQSVEALYRDGLASQKEWVESQSQLEVLRSELEKIQAIRRLYGASSEKGVFVIRAPISGYVTEKNIAPGTPLSGDGSPLFTLADLSELWVMVNVYATHISKVAPGLEVQVRALPYPDRLFTGTISSVAQVLDPDSRVVKARVVLSNPQKLLKPGMLVDVWVTRVLGDSALSLPTEALIFDNDKNYVVVYKSDCDLEVRQIEIVNKYNNITYVSSGIRSGEKIVAKNQLLLYEQLKNFQY